MYYICPILFHICWMTTFVKCGSSPVLQVGKNLEIGEYKSPTARIEPDGVDNIYVREFDTITITCIAAGHPKPNIKWTLTGGTQSRQDIDIFNPALKIKSIRRNEGGRVTCRAINNIGNPAFTTKRINVLYVDKPNLEIQTVSTGVTPRTSIWFEKTVFLYCEAMSNPPAAFTLTLNGSIIRPTAVNGLLQRNIDPYRPGLSSITYKIKNTKDHDLGNYICKASIGRLGRVYNVKDQYANFTYTRDIAPPQIRLKHNKTVVVLNPGENLKLECSAAGTPRPRITWVRESGGFSTRVTIQKKGDALTIQGISIEDSGVYYCIASNNVGLPVRKMTNVVVRDISAMVYWITPDHLQDDRRLAEGTQIKLTCHADAAPYKELKYSWYKLNNRDVRVKIAENNLARNIRIKILTREEMKRGFVFPAFSSRLSITNLAPEDYGVYVCAARLTGAPNNTEVSAKISIGRSSAPARIQTTSPYLVVREGAQASLTCNTFGRPVPLVQWYRDENTTMPSGNIEDFVKGGTLVIPNVNRDASGIYTCTTARFNGFSKLSKTQPRDRIVLEIQYAPSVEPRYEEKRQTLGSTVVLDCYLVDANPYDSITYTWRKDGKIVATAYANKRLELQPIADEDYGIYVCNVTNGIGWDSCVVNVTGYAYAPEFVYNAVSTLRVDDANTGDSNSFVYLLSWTQKFPNKVDAIDQYRIRWRPSNQRTNKISSVTTTPAPWLEDFWDVRGSVEYGKLLTYRIRDLTEGTYDVEVTPKTRFGYGDSNSRVIIARSKRSASGVTPTLRSIASSSFFCRFEKSSICDYIQEQSPKDDFDWTWNYEGNQAKRTPGTGPFFDHTYLSKEGGYMFIESSPVRQGQRARLMTPVFYDEISTQQCLKFFYHMRGRHIGILRVLTRTSTGNESLIWIRQREQGSTWMTGLSTIKQTSPYQIIFEAEMTEAEGFQGDIAVDDVLLEDGSCKLPPTTTAKPSSFSKPQGRGAATSIKATNFNIFSTLFCSLNPFVTSLISTLIIYNAMNLFLFGNSLNI